MNRIILLAMLSGCAHFGSGDIRAGQLQKWSERSQSESHSGPEADAARMKLANGLVKQGQVIAASRLYVDVLAAKQSPTLMVEARTRLETQIWTQRLPPQWLTIGLLKTGESIEDGKNGFHAYLDWLRLIDEGHEDWAKPVQKKWRQDERWQAWHTVQAASRALSEGELDLAEKHLATPELKEISALRSTVHLISADLAWQRGDWDTSIKHLVSLQGAQHLRNEVDIQRGWSHFQRGESGKAIAAARMVLGRPAPLVRRVEAAILEAMVWLDSCQPNRVDSALDAIEKELSVAVTQVRAGAPPEGVEQVLEWVRVDAEEGAIFALAKRAEDEQAELAKQGVVIPSFDGFVATLHQHVHGRIVPAAWRAAHAMDHHMGQLRWIRQQQAFVRPDGPRPSWSPPATNRRFGDVPHVGTNAVLYMYDGEDWSDERHERTVLGRDRCARPSILE